MSCSKKAGVLPKTDRGAPQQAEKRSETDLKENKHVDAHAFFLARQSEVKKIDRKAPQQT